MHAKTRWEARRMNLKVKQTTTLKEISPSDWKKPYIEYLLFGKVISDDLTREEKERIANRSQFFAIMNGKLMRQIHHHCHGLYYQIGRS
jgi:hypothetical protein